MTQASLSTNVPATVEVVSRCLKHLAQEELTLVALVDTLQQTHAALLAGNTDGLIAALRQQQQTALGAEVLRRQRQDFRAHLVSAFGESVRSAGLSELVYYLPADTGDEVLRWQERLRLLVQEMERLQHANAVLLHHGLSFLQRFFTDLMGESSSGRYGPAGRQDSTARPALLETQG